MGQSLGFGPFVVTRGRCPGKLRGPEACRVQDRGTPYRPAAIRPASCGCPKPRALWLTWCFTLRVPRHDPPMAVKLIYPAFVKLLLAEDQHSVGDLGPDGQHDAFGEGVRAWTLRRDLDHLDAGVRQDRIERRRELPGPVADEEPEPGGM